MRAGLAVLPEAGAGRCAMTALPVLCPIVRAGLAVLVAARGGYRALTS